MKMCLFSNLVDMLATSSVTAWEQVSSLLWQNEEELCHLRGKERLQNGVMSEFPSMGRKLLL